MALQLILGRAGSGILYFNSGNDKSFNEDGRKEFCGSCT